MFSLSVWQTTQVCTSLNSYPNIWLAGVTCIWETNTQIGMKMETPVNITLLTPSGTLHFDKNESITFETVSIPKDIFVSTYLKYIGCSIISETALRTIRERDLLANHGTTCIPQCITNATSNQRSLHIQMRPRYSWLPRMCWGTTSEMLTTLPYYTYTVYRRKNNRGDFHQMTRNHNSATRVRTEKFAFMLSKLCISDYVNMEVQTEQLYAIKFCVWLQKLGAEMWQWCVSVMVSSASVVRRFCGGMPNLQQI